MSQTADHLLLQSLCRDLNDVDAQLEALNAQREALRAQLSEIVERMGGKVMVRGFGTLQIAAPVVVASYDRKGIEFIINELIAAGNHALADAIQEHRKESLRSGSLRVVREKSE